MYFPSSERKLGQISLSGNNDSSAITWLASTVGKRGYIARYLRSSSPPGSVVIGTGNERFTPGFMSCDRAFVLPGIRESSYLEAVTKLCEREGVHAAVCLSDLDIEILSQARKRLVELGVACFFPDTLTAMRFLDKVQAAEFFNANGFLTPATFTNIDEAIEAAGWPLVIKPGRGSASAGYGLFHERVPAETHWDSIEAPIAQAYVPGRLINVEACSDQYGRLMALSAWVRHTSIAGETLLTETVEHPAALRTARALLDLSPIPGPIDIDMIDIDGEIYILEINTRFGGGYPASHLAGADFTGALVGALRGELPRALIKYRAGVVMMKELDPGAYDLSRVHEVARYEA